MALTSIEQRRGFFHRVFFLKHSVGMKFSGGTVGRFIDFSEWNSWEEWRMVVNLQCSPNERDQLAEEGSTLIYIACVSIGKCIVWRHALVANVQSTSLRLIYLSSCVHYVDYVGPMIYCFLPFLIPYSSCIRHAWIQLEFTVSAVFEEEKISIFFSVAS